MGGNAENEMLKFLADIKKIADNTGNESISLMVDEILRIINKVDIIER